jgi:hypothetical protein
LITLYLPFFLACSEVRAYNISNSCSDESEHKHHGSREKCLKARAYSSVERVCTQTGQSDIESVFDDCYHDYTYDQHYPIANML